jgi:hypothetical protein
VTPERPAGIAFEREEADMTEAVTESGATTRSRPIGVIFLASLAAIALVLAFFHLLQALGFVPYFIGPIAIRGFNIWYVLMWGLMVWVWWWAFQALLNLDPSAWLFLLIVSGWNIFFDFLSMISATTTYTDLSVDFVLNLVIFAYVLMPGTKRAFAVQ